MKVIEAAVDAQMHGSIASRAGYRPDIDGLRAISVLAVILFHAGVPYFTGGFIGVDVFFVISGFLITRILLEQPQRPLAARLKEFYLRRARRILPALLLVIWVTVFGAWLMYTPGSLTQLGRFAAWCAAMLGNVAAWTTGGYFDTPWATTPLRHLWSIAVEEQFYLLYPVLLLSGLRAMPAKWHVPLVAGAAAASLTLCIWASAMHPAANYYSAPTRAWELLLGALLALGGARAIASGALANALAVLALSVIVAAVLVIDNATIYPGINAIPPALAAATLIFTGSGHAAAVNRWLALPPLVFIGLISYSLYLWHAPVQILFAYYNIEPPGATQKLGLLLATGLLAVLSWALVERPIRSRRLLRGNSVFAWVALTCSAATVAGGWALARSDGFPQRFTPAVQRLVANEDWFAEEGTRCMGLAPARIDAGELCRLGNTGARSTVLLWGDSHAWAMLPALLAIAKQNDLGVYFAGWSGCRPLSGVRSGFLPARAEANCAEFNGAMMRAVQKLRPDAIVLDAYWTLGDTPAIADPQLDIAPLDSAFSRGLRETVRQIGASSRSVCVIHGVPVLEYSPPHALSMARLRGIDDKVFEVTRIQALAQQKSVDDDIRELARRGVLRSVDPKHVICPDSICRLTTDDGRTLYRDNNHLSIAGAMLVAPALAECLR
jgi:peptidoglycan/LPS O-acetylase OafA/YrhL